MRITLLTITALALASALPLTSPGTGIPVVDVASIAQEIKNGLTEIQQYTTQVSQLETALNSYKQQVLSATGIAQAAQIYQQASGTINQVRNVATLFSSSSGLQGYLSEATNINYWLSTTPTLQTTSQSENYWSQTQQQANDALATEIKAQQAELTSDATALQRLQTQAPTAATEQESLNLATEISSLGTKSLLELRTLMLSQQQALAARQGSDATNQAVQQAATQKGYGTVYLPTTAQGW